MLFDNLDSIARTEWSLIAMAKTVIAQGSYKAPTGIEVTYDFDYQVLSKQEIQGLDAILPGAGRDTQRMRKIDANNAAREKAKSDNGHSSRKPMSEEQKAQAKAARQADKKLLDVLRQKGLTLADVMKLEPNI